MPERWTHSVGQGVAIGSQANGILDVFSYKVWRMSNSVARAV